MNERMEAVVSGRVQLVMYRDFAQRKARRLKLAGEVQNLPNGTVRVVAEGPRGTLERYIALLKRGSVLARVDEVRARWLSATGEYRDFHITYS